MIPDLSSILLTIGGAVVGNAAILAVLAFVGRGLFNAAVTRDLESFKATLKAQGDAELERVRQLASREIESYKVKLKKSEFLFQRQFEAANAILKLFSEFSPQKSHPMMEWSDAMDEVARSAKETEQRLREFMIQHGAALAAADRETLQNSITVTNNLFMDEYDDTEKASSELHDMLERLRDSLIAKVQDQSSL